MAIVVIPPVDDYTPLLARIADWLDRTDLTTKIPTFISLAENAMFRELRLRQTEIIRQGTTTSDTIVLPLGIRAIEKLAITSSGVEYILDYASDGVSKLTYSTGLPSRYTIENNAIRLLISPSQTYTYKLHYIPNLDPISTTNTSNWLSTNAPDLYLFGALVQAAFYTMDDAQAARFGPRFSQTLDSVRQVDEALRLPMVGGLQIKPRNAR